MNVTSALYCHRHYFTVFSCVSFHSTPAKKEGVLSFREPGTCPVCRRRHRAINHILDVFAGIPPWYVRTGEEEHDFISVAASAE